MVIEKVHGLHATSMSLSDRFTMLSSTAPDLVAARPRRRQAVGDFLTQNLNYRNRNLIEQIARRLEQQAKRQVLRQRLGFTQGALRRFGSEGSIPGLKRSNSFSNFSQQSVKNRVSWRYPNSNMRRSASFSNLSGGQWRGRPLRGFRRRGGGQRALRGRFVFRGGRGRQNVGRVTRVQQRPRTQMPQRGNARGRGRGRGRGGARGGISRNQTPNPVLTKEELDAQLDQYMASSKSALDRELDTYMKNAIEME